MNYVFKLFISLLTIYVSDIIKFLLLYILTDFRVRYNYVLFLKEN